MPEPDQQASNLARIQQLVEAMTRLRMSEVIERELDDAPKKKLYELTGTKDTRELTKITGLSAGTISHLWKRWYSMGLLVKDGRYYRKLFEDDVADV